VQFFVRNKISLKVEPIDIHEATTKIARVIHHKTLMGFYTPHFSVEFVLGFEISKKSTLNYPPSKDSEFFKD